MSAPIFKLRTVTVAVVATHGKFSYDGHGHRDGTHYPGRYIPGPVCTSIEKVVPNVRTSTYKYVLFSVNHGLARRYMAIHHEGRTRTWPPRQYMKNIP
jgi:hypothetical protein